MSKFLRGRMTFSNVVAVLALFVALGGSAYAASKLSGKSIKPKSIPANRIKPNSLTSSQIKDGSLKAVKSAAGLSNVTYATASGTLDPAATTPITVTANCPAGQKAIGGGATVSDPTKSAFVNDMTFTSGQTGYVAFFFSGTTSSTGTVTAACVPVG